MARHGVALRAVAQYALQRRCGELALLHEPPELCNVSWRSCPGAGHPPDGSAALSLLFMGHLHVLGATRMPVMRPQQAQGTGPHAGSAGQICHPQLILRVKGDSSAGLCLGNALLFRAC